MADVTEQVDVAGHEKLVLSRKVARYGVNNRFVHRNASKYEVRGKVLCVMDNDENCVAVYPIDLWDYRIVGSITA